MNLSGEIAVRAPRQAVFDAVRDARFFASCIDGVRELEEIDPTHYTALFETKLAYMTFRFKVAVEVTRLTPPDRIEAKLEGTPLGVIGRLTAISVTTLTEDGDETRIGYAIEVALSVTRDAEKSVRLVSPKRLRAQIAKAEDDSRDLLAGG